MAKVRPRRLAARCGSTRGAPPLTVAEDEIDLAVTIIDEALQTITNRRAAGVSN